MNNQIKNFSFCETQYSTGNSPWHIRLLTDQGPKFGGGADTKSLCGREVAWDLEVDITQHHLTHCCDKCSQEFKPLFRDSELNIKDGQDG